jgi:hypothetical protein
MPPSTWSTSTALQLQPRLQRLFRDESGNATDAQLLAIEDTWHWGPSAEATYAYQTNTARHECRVPDEVSTIIAAQLGCLARRLSQEGWIPPLPGRATVK